MDDEKKPKVTIADLSAQHSNDAQEQPTEASGIKPDYTFFNVMPKSKMADSMTQPTLKVEAPPVENSNAAGSFFKKNKTYVIVGTGILIVGALIYFIAAKSGGSKPADSLINQSQFPRPNRPKSVSTTTPTTTVQTDLTTSQEWRDKYFPGCKDSKTCGDDADPDQDGLTNLIEFQKGTDPNNPDSDGDGISDGDEVNIFNSDPLNAHTANDSQYTDGEYFKGGYDINSGNKMTPQQLGAISAKMRNFGLHPPTLKTLAEVLNSLYNFSPPGVSNTKNPGFASTTQDTSFSATGTPDQSIGAKQDRDAQRSNTIKNIETGLVRYNKDNKSYPETNDFGTMYTEIKPYLTVATNPLDPINKSPYVYSYSSTISGTEFTLTFYSEVAGQPIKKHSADAQKDTASQQAAILDEQRRNDLENIRSALLLYSQNNTAGNQTYVFPSTDKYKTALVPTYLQQIPKDPKTGQDYLYQVSSTFNTFTLKATLDNPAVGTTGYSCNQDECADY